MNVSVDFLWNFIVKFLSSMDAFDFCSKKVAELSGIWNQLSNILFILTNLTG